MAEPIQPTQQLSATLEAQEWNIVLAGLGKLPYEISAGVIQKLRPQLMPDEQPVNGEVPVGRGRT